MLRAGRGEFNATAAVCQNRTPRRTGRQPRLLAGILGVLRTGNTWADLPLELG